MSLLLWVFNHCSRPCPCPEAPCARSPWGTCGRRWCCPAAHQLFLEDLPWGLHNGRTLQVPPHLAPLCKHFGNNQPWGGARRRSLSGRGDGQHCPPVPAGISTGLGHLLSYSSNGASHQKNYIHRLPFIQEAGDLVRAGYQISWRGLSLGEPTLTVPGDCVVL